MWHLSYVRLYFSFHILIYFTLTTNQLVRYYYYTYFTYEVIEAPSGFGHTAKKWKKQDLNPDSIT